MEAFVKTFIRHVMLVIFHGKAFGDIIKGITNYLLPDWSFKNEAIQNPATPIG